MFLFNRVRWNSSKTTCAPSDVVQAQMKRAAAAYAARRPPAVAKSQHRVVSLADIHGDHDRLLVLLCAAGVLCPKTLSWAGGTDTLVQTGDLIDRGSQDYLVVETMLRLQSEAAKAGGKVVILKGNHETMTLAGSYGYASSTSRAAYGEPFEDIWKKNSGRYYKYFEAAPFVYHELGSLYVHAFVHPNFPSILLKAMREKKSGPFNFHYNEYEFTPLAHELGTVEPVKDDKERNAILKMINKHGTGNLVWDRPFYECPRSEFLDNVVKESLRLLKCDRMVVGHTPIEKPTCEVGCFYMMDTGVSRWMRGGKGSLFEVTKSKEDENKSPNASIIDVPEVDPIRKIIKSF